MKELNDNPDNLSNDILTKKETKMSTLQLWQAHLRALSQASNEKTHTVEVIDTTEQTSSTVVVKLPSERPSA